MLNPLQSAYRDKHSTETAFIKVQNAILSALDEGSSAILLMLDVSTALKSYLTGRILHVVIEYYVSVDQELGFEFRRVLFLF